MSIANAINVRRAARKDRIEAIRVTVTWVEQEKSNAIKVTAVATGCTASPRVQALPMITLASLFTSEMATE